MKQWGIIKIIVDKLSSQGNIILQSYLDDVKDILRWSVKNGLVYLEIGKSI